MQMASTSSAATATMAKPGARRSTTTAISSPRSTSTRMGKRCLRRRAAARIAGARPREVRPDPHSDRFWLITGCASPAQRPT